MKFFYFFISIIAAILCLISCHKNEEYVEETYDKIYTISNIGISAKGDYGVDILAEVVFDKEFDTESRLYYNGIDSSLVFKGWRDKITNNNREFSSWCAIDWRLKSIEFKTLTDFDESHLAGSLLNDIVEIRYEYMHSQVCKRLDQIFYGNTMLLDYYPFGERPMTFQLSLIDQGEHKLQSYEVSIYDGFGQVFILRSTE